MACFSAAYPHPSPPPPTPLPPHMMDNGYPPSYSSTQLTHTLFWMYCTPPTPRIEIGVKSLKGECRENFDPLDLFPNYSPIWASDFANGFHLPKKFDCEVRQFETQRCQKGQTETQTHGKIPEKTWVKIL